MNPNIDATKTIFKAMCPNELQIVAVEQNFGNHERPCRWLVKYEMRNGDTTFENAKTAFENILRLILFNTQFADKNISGPPNPTFNVLYRVTNCACPALDFEVDNFILKQKEC
jgi:hypothetical protein